MKCFAVSDLHGSLSRYRKLFREIKKDVPEILLITGDILPTGGKLISDNGGFDDFINDFLRIELTRLKIQLGEKYPEIYLILGNDDPKSYENEILQLEEDGIWKYLNEKVVIFKDYLFTGYSYVPPTPFLFKDWEKYDVSRYIDPGCVSPEEGFRSVDVEKNIIRYSTISEDLNNLFSGYDLSNAIMLFHSPPYQTNLDKLFSGDKFHDYVKLDNYAGSIAIRRFIENKQPLISLHGHIHESTRISGNWRDYINKTLCINSSADSKDLSLVKIEIDPEISAKRFLI
jgi:uncharacterized protein